MTLPVILQALKPSESDLEKLAKTVALARQVAEALNPPTIWDQVWPKVIVRSLTRSGLLTQSEAEDVEKRVAEASKQ